jgi:hypothetical protein
MRALAKDETELWCRRNGVALDSSGLPIRPNHFTTIDIPPDAQQRVWFVAQSMQAFSGEPAVLVLFDDWAVWPSGQRMHIFDRLRLSYEESRPLIQAPGHVFEGNEFEDVISFVTLGVLFLFDCYVVTPQHSRFLFFSHDEFCLMDGKFEP